MLFTYPLMVGIQLASARIGRVTGRGLAGAFERFCPRSLVAGLVLLLLTANVINLGADLSAMGDAAAMVLPGRAAWYAVGFGVVSLLLQVFLPYERYVRVLKWLTLSLFAYVGVVFVVGVDWGAAIEAAGRAVVPVEQGTTSRPWSRSSAPPSAPISSSGRRRRKCEEIKRVPEDQPLRIAPEQARRHLRRLRIDTAVGMGFSNLIAFFMITRHRGHAACQRQDRHRDHRAGGRGAAADRGRRGLRAVRDGHHRHRHAGAAGACRLRGGCGGELLPPAQGPGPAAGPGPQLLRHPRGRHGGRRGHQPVGHEPDLGALLVGGDQRRASRCR